MEIKSEAYNLGYTFLITAAMQMSFFLVAYTLQIDKVTDFAGTTNFIILALFTFPCERYSLRQVLLTLAIVAWGVRISAYLLYRILKTDKDDRFNEIRGNFFRFLRFWLLQMLWVWLVSLPITLVNSNSGYHERSFGLKTDLIGLSVSLFGLVVETVADLQKFQASQDRKNRPFYMTTGLWRYSRHPNYFGEIIFWWGIFLASLGDFSSPTRFLGILSPLVTMGLLLLLSGIPLSERQKDISINESKDANLQENYYTYIRTTSPLILFFPGWYAALPDVFKKVFFFELPIYRHESSLKAQKKHKKLA